MSRLIQEYPSGKEFIGWLGLGEIYDHMPSKNTASIAFDALTSLIALSASSPLSTALGTYTIISQKDCAIAHKVFFTLSFLSAAALTSLVGLHLGQAVLLLILAYIKYKQYPALFQNVAIAFTTVGIISLAARLFRFQSSKEEDALHASLEAALNSFPSENRTTSSQLAIGTPELVQTLAENTKVASGWTEELLAHNPAEKISTGTVLMNQFQTLQPVVKATQKISGTVCVASAILASERGAKVIGKCCDTVQDILATDESEELDTQDKWGYVVVEKLEKHRPALKKARDISGSIFIASTVASSNRCAGLFSRAFNKVWG